MEGQIVKIISNLYFVNIKDNVYKCRSRGLFRNKKITPVVGDNCIIDPKEGYILDILPRKNYLIRPLVSNVDQGLIVTSLKIPDFSFNLLDKLILVMEINHIRPIICITKKDLLSESEFLKIETYINYYKKIGYLCFYNDDLESLKDIFKGKTTVFTGQTGAGKSSLFNALAPNLNFAVGDVSISLGRGKHTTRHVELISLFDGKLVDTPGFSSIDLSCYSQDEIKNSFTEFKDYTCRYKDCMHVRESVDECGVKRAVENGDILKSRYDDYCKFLTEK